MQKTSKIDNRLRLRLVKISAGLILIGLLVLLRELGWNDVVLWPAIIGLIIMLAGVTVVGYLATSQSVEYGQGKKDEASGQNDSQKELDKTSIHYRIHRSENNDTTASQAERSLRLLATTLPDKILALYTVKAENMAFYAGARMNSRQQSENIKAADELVNELTSRINSCVDGSTLKQARQFTKPLTFSRSQNSNDAMLLPVSCDNEIFAVLAVLSFL